MKQQQYIDLEDEFGAHNYKQLDVVLNRGEGVWVWDVDGKKYLDCLSAYSAVNQGHCHPKIMNAMIDQAKKLTLTSRAFRNDQLGLFYQELCKLTNSHKVLPMNSGAEAVETVIKTVRKWGYKVKGVPENQAEIIVCENNFHGRTITIVGFSTDPDAYEGFGPKTPGFKVIPFGDVEALEKAITKNTVVFMFEPIQGEAGVLIPPEGYIKKVQDICKINNVILIADEIQTGFCRAGELLACQYESVKPDVTLVAKAVGGGVFPVSGVLSSWDIMGVLTPGSHGSTWGGNSAGMAVLEAVCDLLIENDFSQKSKDLGKFFMNGLKDIQKKYPEIF